MQIVVGVDFRAHGASGESNDMGVQSVGYLALDTVKRTSANEEDVFGVDGDHFLFRVLSASVRRDVDNRSFEQFEQSLLHTLA